MGLLRNVLRSVRESSKSHCWSCDVARLLTDVNGNTDWRADDIVNAVGDARIGDKRNARLDADNTPTTIISQKKFMGIRARLDFHVSSPAGKGIINFGAVYPRENALGSRFENRRGKIRPKFACTRNYLTVWLLSSNIRLVCNKDEC